MDTIFTKGDCESVGYYWLVPVCSVCGYMDTDMTKWTRVSNSGHVWVWTDVTDYSMEILEDGTVCFIAEDYEFDAYCAICGTETALCFSRDDLDITTGDGNAAANVTMGVEEYNFSWTFKYASDDIDCEVSTLGYFTAEFTRSLADGEPVLGTYDESSKNYVDGDAVYGTNDNGATYTAYVRRCERR